MYRDDQLDLRAVFESIAWRDLAVIPVPVPVILKTLKTYRLIGDVVRPLYVVDAFLLSTTYSIRLIAKRKICFSHNIPKTRL
jgi:hypothetical protein